jgi:hypothetical protein
MRFTRTREYGTAGTALRETTRQCARACATRLKARMQESNLPTATTTSRVSKHLEAAKLA